MWNKKAEGSVYRVLLEMSYHLFQVAIQAVTKVI